MRMLITGGHGQLGRALQAALNADEVTALGHSHLDITDPQQVSSAFARHDPEVVIHAAAWTDTAGCERDPERALHVNGEGAGIVAGACRASGATMLYVSTNEVFDGEKSEPYAEDDPPNPINVYGRSKREGEQRVQTALDHPCIVRTSWLYGPGRDSFPEKIVAAARQQNALRLVTDEVASPTWTVDLAQAIAVLAHKRATGIYHLTNAGACSRKEWAEEIVRLAGMKDISIEATSQSDFGAPFRKPPFSALANTNAARLGVTLRPWQEALADHFQRAKVSQGALR
jgi:dTDP-4-dehydrorhamnose reductase